MEESAYFIDFYFEKSKNWAVIPATSHKTDQLGMSSEKGALSFQVKSLSASSRFSFPIAA